MRGIPFAARPGAVTSLGLAIALALSGMVFRCESGTAPRHHHVPWERLHGVIAVSRRHCPSSCVAELLVVDATRREVRGVTQLSGTALGSLAWAPDGRITFSRLGGATSEIDAVALDGGAPVTLFRPGAAPAWSPDGRAAYSCPSYQLCLDGSLAPGPSLRVNATRPAWAPDGVHVIVATTDALARGSLQLMDVRDGTARTLHPAGGARDDAVFGDPAYSPDGMRVAFTRWGGSSGDASEIWVMNADGSGASALTRGDRDGEPSWSPDGGLLVFVRGGRAMVMNEDGSDVEPLDDVDAGADVVSVAWRPGWVAH